MRQLAVHLVGVVLIQIENLLTRGSVQLGVLADMFVEALQIGETLLLRYDQHPRLDVVHLLQPHLVNLLRQKFGGGHAPDIELISCVAVGQ